MRDEIVMKIFLNSACNCWLFSHGCIKYLKTGCRAFSHSVRGQAGGRWFFSLSILLFLVSVSASFAQPFEVFPRILNRTNIQISFQGNANSYYLLLTSSSLTNISAPVSAVLGIQGTNMFQTNINGST